MPILGGFFLGSSACRPAATCLGRLEGQPGEIRFTGEFGPSDAFCWCEFVVWIYFMFELGEHRSASGFRTGGSILGLRPGFIGCEATAELSKLQGFFGHDWPSPIG